MSKCVLIGSHDFGTSKGRGGTYVGFNRKVIVLNCPISDGACEDSAIIWCSNVLQRLRVYSPKEDGTGSDCCFLIFFVRLFWLETVPARIHTYWFFSFFPFNLLVRNGTGSEGCFHDFVCTCFGLLSSARPLQRRCRGLERGSAIW